MFTIIGETIIDRIVYVRRSKNAASRSTPTYDALDEEMHAGGALAVYRELKRVFSEVDLLTNCIPEESLSRPHVRDVVVKSRYISAEDGKTIWKLNRIPEATSRLAESHVMNGKAAIVYDYGHGWLDSYSWQVIRERFDVVFGNYQVNSTTDPDSFHPRYDLLDYAFLNREESLAVTGIADDIERSLAALIQKHKETVFIITDSFRGVYLGSAKHGHKRFDFTGEEGSEPTGAGDIFQAIFAFRLMSGASLDDSVWAAHSMASIKAKTWFHREVPIETLHNSAR